MPCVYNPFSQLAASSPVRHWGLAFTFYCENRRWHFGKQCIVSNTLTAARGGASLSCYSSIFCICSGSRKWNSFLTAKAGQPFTSRDFAGSNRRYCSVKLFSKCRYLTFAIMAPSFFGLATEETLLWCWQLQGCNSK